MHLFALVLSLLTTSVWALDWSDIEVQQSYRLGQDFRFPTGEAFLAGEELIITDKVGLSIGVILIEAQLTHCQYPGRELEVEIFPVPTEIGLAVVPDCLLWFYVENRDYYSTAPLK